MSTILLNSENALMIELNCIQNCFRLKSLMDINYALGKDPMFWYRREQSLGRNSIVGIDDDRLFTRKVFPQAQIGCSGDIGNAIRLVVGGYSHNDFRLANFLRVLDDRIRIFRHKDSIGLGLLEMGVE